MSFSAHSLAAPSFSSIAGRHFDVTPLEYLGGRHKQVWKVAGPGGSVAVLRRHDRRVNRASLEFELSVIGYLAAADWPVPLSLAEPAEIGDHVWTLHRWLPGQSRSAEDLPEQRERGRLLAHLHEVLATQTHVGQRPGWYRADAIIADPVLEERLKWYERRLPEEGRLLRWHKDHAARAFDELGGGGGFPGATHALLHSDFVPWNLLYEGDRLTGVLDFESSHTNFAVADFALAWRAKHDDVIMGYQEVRPLSELDLALLGPVYWAWMFIGVRDAIDEMVLGRASITALDWTRTMLPRRTKLMGQPAYDR